MLKAMSLGNGVYCAGAGAERQRNGIISQRDTEWMTRQEKNILQKMIWWVL